MSAAQTADAGREPGGRDGRPSRARLFYDGACGLCHRSVRFVLARDPDGSRFCFTPLGSPAAKRILAGLAAEDLPDSLVLQCPDGRLLFRSDAVVGILERLGGWWPIAAVILRRCPSGVRDALYDRVASLRGRLFEKPTDACPVIDPALRDRFDDGLDATYASE